MPMRRFGPRSLRGEPQTRKFCQPLEQGVKLACVALGGRNPCFVSQIGEDGSKIGVGLLAENELDHQRFSASSRCAIRARCSASVMVSPRAAAARAAPGTA